jgi:hypothetical protein
MRIRIFQREVHASTLADLRSILSWRNESTASFWLYGDNGSSMATMVRNESACVHYFPNQEHPGFYAVGMHSDWDNWVELVADNYEATEVRMAMIIPWVRAEAAAAEFFQSNERPSSLSWEDL